MLYLVLPITLILVLGQRLWKKGILYIDPFYVAIRNNGVPEVGFISKGLLRQIVRPWRRGTGIEFKVNKYVLHVGICWRKRMSDDTTSTLASLDGRWLEADPMTIKGWIK